MRKLLFVIVVAFLSVGMYAQQPVNKYIVKTKGAAKTVQAAAVVEEEEKPQDLLTQYVRYVSVCDWKEGMRFMVIPDKKDIIIKTFVDAATGKMVSSLSLRHKIMIYKGYESVGGIHEHLNFNCEDDGKAYYFEIPSVSYEDYCLGRSGVPALAYLGDVDMAREVLMGKTLLTQANQYYVDTELDGDGCAPIFDVPVNTEVKVVAVGVGTRNFPVKVIVADENGREFFQNVAISRTNSGMRDDEFDASSMKLHSFKGSFELLSDNMTASSEFKDYLGKDVYTLNSTTMADSYGARVKVARLSVFTIKDIKPQRGQQYVKMTLTGHGSGREYTMMVILRSDDATGDIATMSEHLFSSIFAWGDPMKMEGVRQSNLQNVQKGIVKVGFTENEVRLALGEPTDYGTDDHGHYTWIYKYNDRSSLYARIFFSIETRRVTGAYK